MASVSVDTPAKIAQFLAASHNPRPVFDDLATYRRYISLRGNVSYADRSLVWNQFYETHA